MGKAKTLRYVVKQGGQDGRWGGGWEEGEPVRTDETDHSSFRFFLIHIF